MNSIEQKSNENTFEKNKTPEDDLDCKKSISTETKSTISLFTSALTNDNSPSETKSAKNEHVDMSDTDSVPDKDLLTPLGCPKLENLSYIETEIPIYANLYKIELERNYTLYEYAVTFAHEKDDKYTLSTPFKQRIINTVSSKIAQNFKNFIFTVGHYTPRKKWRGGARSPPSITPWNTSLISNQQREK